MRSHMLTIAVAFLTIVAACARGRCVQDATSCYTRGLKSYDEGQYDKARRRFRSVHPPESPVRRSILAPGSRVCPPGQLG